MKKIINCHIKIILVIICILFQFSNEILSQDIPESILKEAYERMQYDIRASHILIFLDKDAYPTDTLSAYKKIMALRDRILNGEAFETIAMEASDDPSAHDHKDTSTKIVVNGNGGDLGYFSVLDMIYPFETVAYNTPVGKVSMPVRSDFGYHLIKVTDRKAAMGKITLAHIFVNIPSDAEPIEIQKYKEKINEVNSKLKSGGKWEELIIQYSDDKGSSIKGGQLPELKVNQMVPEFILTIRNLKNPGDISEPILTRYGWHIIKLINKTFIGTYEEEKSTLIERIIKDSRYLNNYNIDSSQVKYSDYLPSEKIKLFDDNFINNENNWPIGDQHDFECEIVDGIYHCRGKKYGSDNPFISVDIDQQNDFEVEISVKIIKGGLSFQWWREDALLRYKFHVSKQPKKYKSNVAYYYYSQESSILDDICNKPYINTDYNKLTIRKVDDFYYFFLNEYLICKSKYHGLPGEYFGFELYNNYEILVDYFKISYLPIDDLTAFKKAKDKNTIESYKDFLNKYQNDSLVKETEKLIEKIQWYDMVSAFQSAKTENTSSAYQNFIMYSQNDSLTKLAEELIEEAKFNEISQKKFIGFWRVTHSTNGSILVSSDPTSEILQFKTNWVIDLQIETIKYSRGTYSINKNQIDVKFNHMYNDVIYKYNLDDDNLILQNNNEKIILKKIHD